MAIDEFVEKTKELLKNNTFKSEAAVSQGILLPALHELGWPVFNTSVVIPEYSVEGRRVDYALCHPATRPSVFIEVKNVGLSEGADRQLFEYAFHIGVPMAILTDGQEWSFYLPGEQGRYDERRVYKLDLLERTSEEASARLTKYLSYQRVCTGEALKAARSDYQNVARGREVESTFPEHGLRSLKKKTHCSLIFSLKRLKACAATDLIGMIADNSSRQGSSPWNSKRRHRLKLCLRPLRSLVEESREIQIRWPSKPRVSLLRRLEKKERLPS